MAKNGQPGKVASKAKDGHAPLIMTRELGVFTKHGSRVELLREAGRATIRDKIVCRELEAARAPAGMVFAAMLGLRCVAKPCLKALVLNDEANEPTRERAQWVVDQLATWRRLPDPDMARESAASAVFRPDLFQAARKAA